jgi:hypothetical protein
MSLQNRRIGARKVASPKHVRKEVFVTDRYYALTVLLNKEIRKDDCESVIEAIKMIRHVMKVVPQVAQPELYFAQEQAKFDLRNQLWNLLK